MAVAFIQPFGVHGPAGGPRILRALLKDAPVPVFSVCTSPNPPRPGELVHEDHVPSRPRFGRLESTRLHKHLSSGEVLLERGLEKRLREVLADRGATAAHLVIHGPDFWPAWRAARALGLPVFISLHDHLGYVLRGRVDLPLSLRRLGPVWRGAEGRFVISPEFGEHLSEAYGARPFELVTDGVESIAEPRPRPPHRCTVYFMGAFHVTYADNLVALLGGLERFQPRHPELEVRLVMRGGLPEGLPPASTVDVSILPFASEDAVREDLLSADLLWMPLPLRDDRDLFVRYSLSTKLVSYAASGIPILYHGPGEAAAAAVLRSADAAELVESNTPEEVERAVDAAIRRGPQLAANAAAIAAERFGLAANRERFWRPIAERVSGPRQSALSPD